MIVSLVVVGGAGCAGDRDPNCDRDFVADGAGQAVACEVASSSLYQFLDSLLARIEALVRQMPEVWVPFGEIFGGHCAGA